jgi:hypothetical protein
MLFWRARRASRTVRFVVDDDVGEKSAPQLEKSPFEALFQRHDDHDAGSSDADADDDVVSKPYGGGGDDEQHHRQAPHHDSTPPALQRRVGASVRQRLHASPLHETSFNDSYRRADDDDAAADADRTTHDADTATTEADPPGMCCSIDYVDTIRDAFEVCIVVVVVVLVFVVVPHNLKSMRHARRHHSYRKQWCWCTRGRATIRR